MANAKHRRRQHFIKKRFQFNFILKFCILIAIGGAVSTGLLFFFSKGTLTSTFEGSRLVIRNTAEVILPGIIYTNLITMVLISIASIAVTLFISHKIAGPLFRLEQDILVIAKGDLSKKIFLRQADQVTEMADNLNKMVIELREKVVDIDGELGALVAKAPEADVPAAFAEELKTLQGKIRTHFTF